MGRVVSLEELELELAGNPEAKVVLTNGCFDILHVGHLSTLRKAKAMGDVLVVAVNSDESVRGLKGPGRPIVPEIERAELVAALDPVDFVVIFPEPTPETVIRRVRPAIQVKGGDYCEEDLPEAEAVRSYGGKIVIVDEVQGKSTTEISERMKREGGTG